MQAIGRWMIGLVWFGGGCGDGLARRRRRRVVLGFIEGGDVEFKERKEVEESGLS